MDHFPPELIHLIALVNPRAWRQLLALPPFARHVREETFQYSAKKKFARDHKKTLFLAASKSLIVKYARKIYDNCVYLDDLPGKERVKVSPGKEQKRIVLPHNSPVGWVRDDFIAKKGEFTPTNISLRSDFDYGLQIIDKWPIFVYKLLQIAAQIPLEELRYYITDQKFEKYTCRFKYQKEVEIYFLYRTRSKLGGKHIRKVTLSKNYNGTYSLSLESHFLRMVKINFKAQKKLFD